MRCRSLVQGGSSLLSGSSSLRRLRLRQVALVATATAETGLRASAPLSTWAASNANLASSTALSSSRSFSTSPLRRNAEQEEPPREQTSGERDIEEILVKEFAPKHLQVQDVSGGCGSFYTIIIASSKFNGINTIKAHRLVNAALKDIIKDIHGLQLRTMPVDG